MRRGKWEASQGVSGRFRQVFQTLCITHRNCNTQVKVALIWSWTWWHIPLQWDVQWRHLEPDLVVGDLHPDRCQLAPVLAVPSSLTPTSSTREAFLGAISSSGERSLLSHNCNSLLKWSPNPLHHSISLRQLAEQISAVPWQLPEFHSHTTPWLCTAVSGVNPN